MTAATLDPKIAQALMPFSPQIKKLALAAVDRFIKAVNAGDEAAADAVDDEIFQARGNYGRALDAVLGVVNGKASMTLPQIDKLIAADLTGEFVLVSNAFGYPMYATKVDSAESEYTDTLDTATRFDHATNDAAKLAAAMSRACGFAFTVVSA